MTQTIIYTIAAAFALAWSIPANAALILADNFDDSTAGSLDGQTADTGQTWELFDSPSAWVNAVQVDTIYGQGGTPGAGWTGTSASTGPDRARVITDLGQDLGPGIYTFSMDMFRAAPGSNQMGFNITNGLDGGDKEEIGMGWDGAAIRVGGNIWTGAGGLAAAAPASGRVHAEWVLDLKAAPDIQMSTVSVSWFNIDDPSINGTAGPITPLVDADKDGDGTWNMVQADFFVVGDTVDAGVDNVSLSFVPEPGTFVLLSCGLLSLLARTRRPSE